MINKDELLTVVDEKNNLLEPRPRQEVHFKKLWHRVSHVWIYNSHKQILCQKRSLLKDSAPGYWEPFFGGHLQPGVEYLNGAKSELKEELGIQFDNRDLVFWKIYKLESGKEFQGVFVCKWDGQTDTIIFEKEEIDEIKWIDFEELNKIILKEKRPKWSYMGYEDELFPYMRELLK